MSPLSEERHRAMAGGLTRAADHFDARAKELDEVVNRWRKDRRNGSSPVIASTFHGVARDLRRWAENCRRSH